MTGVCLYESSCFYTAYSLKHEAYISVTSMVGFLVDRPDAGGYIQVFVVGTENSSFICGCGDLC